MTQLPSRLQAARVEEFWLEAQRTRRGATPLPVALLGGGCWSVTLRARCQHPACVTTGEHDAAA